MIYRILSFQFLLFLSPFIAKSQHVMGTVFERTAGNKEVPLADANVFFQGTTVGTTTDETGMFHLDKPESSSEWLVISYMGYQNDTVKAEGYDLKIVLGKTILLKEVEVSGVMADSYISSLNTQKTEIISQGELQNNACCNLSESFESNPTVDVSFSDAVTGARQIQMLGLAGKYAQILTDVLPTVRGLSTYGLNYIPGPWIQAIHLNKGSGSVTNGYESITGQIDVELMKPEASPKLFVNLYGNSEQRLEGNINAAQMLNENWSHMTLLHGDMLQKPMDGNKDNFLDLPVNKTVSLMDRWKYDSKNRVEGMFGFKVLHDERIGGSIDFEEEKDKLTTNNYGLGINTDRVEVFTKTSYGFPLKLHQSVGLQVSGIYHKQDAFYGLRAYTGEEKNLYANLIFQSILTNSQHKFKTGISYNYDEYEENFDSLPLMRAESVPGLFVEYTYDNLERLSLVAGLRTDLHNLYGFIVTPRLHLKYNLGNTSVLRASAGSGFHVANIFAENPAYLASSREWVIAEPLQPERAWNYGINFTQKFYTGPKEGTFSIDLYRTDFTSQVIVDADNDPTKVFFYNLKGKSYSNSAQVDLGYEWFTGFTTRIAYKLYDVKQTYNGELRDVPLVPKQRALLTLNYKTPDKHWEFSSTTQWIGEQRLPDTQLNPEVYQSFTEAPDYFRQLAQVTYIIRNWEFYLGGENLNNFTQEDPLISAEDPFGPYFDTSMIWGLITGRMFYAGLRFTLK